MAFEIVKVYKEHFPALRLIGKRYTDADRGENGMFDLCWDTFHQNGWFDLLRKSNPSKDVESSELGLMTIKATDHSDFSYWIGILFPVETKVPNGFDYLDLPESDIGMTHIYGSDENGEIYGHDSHTAAYNKLCEAGMGELNTNAGGRDTLVFFEQYTDKLHKSDENGKIILNYGFYIK
jgi:predicted transcriptional regulator YdeE